MVSKASKISLSGVEIHLDSRELVVRGKVKRLPWRAFDILLVLVENAGAVVPKEQLLKQVWGGVAVDDSNLTQAVAQIRKAVGEIADGTSYIETIPRIGYRIVAQAVVSPVPEPEPTLPFRPAAQQAPRAAARRWTPAILAIALTTLVAGMAAVIANSSRNRFPEADPVETPFTALEGEELSGSFSPDGREVVFTWARHGGTSDIYLKALYSETVRPFVVSDSIEMGPVFSRDGRFIAFLRLTTDAAMIIVKPRDGGPERIVTGISKPHVALLANPGPYLAWTNDSRGLIYAHNRSLHLWRLAESRPVRITNPPGTAALGDADPALSPDGRTLIFVRVAHVGSADLYRLPLNGNFEPAGPPTVLLSNGYWNRSPAWHPDDRRVVFNSGPWGRQRLWSLDVREPSSAKPIPGAGADAQQPAVSPLTGDVLYTRWFFRRQIWSFLASGRGRVAQVPRPLFASTRADSLPRVSRDGSHIVFSSDRSGTFELWLARSDGSDLRKVTSFDGLPAGSPDLSPDGKTVAFDHLVDGQRDIFLSDLYGGNLRRLTDHPADDVIPRWSADGKSIYFASHRGGPSEIWKADVASGQAMQMTRGGGVVAEESSDGRTLYFTSADGGSTAIFAMPAGGGDARKILAPVWHRAMSVTSDGIYFVSPHNQNEVRFLDFTSGSERRVIAFPESIHSLAADYTGRLVAINVSGPPSGDLMLIREPRFP